MRSIARSEFAYGGELREFTPEVDDKLRREAGTIGVPVPYLSPYETMVIGMPLRGTPADPSSEELLLFCGKSADTITRAVREIAQRGAKLGDVKLYRIAARREPGAQSRPVSRRRGPGHRGLPRRLSTLSGR